MDNLLKIYDSSLYLQNILEDINKNENKDENENENKDENENEINNLLIKTFELLNLNFNLNLEHDKCIIYLLNLIDNYRKISYDNNNILQYVILSDYFMLNNQYIFLDYIINKFIFNAKIFYDKLHLQNSINYCILDRFSKTLNIPNSTFKYIFKVNKNICNEIKILSSTYIKQSILNECTNIIELNIEDNKNVISVNHLKFLEKLDISGTCAVNQTGITELCLIKILDASNNYNITDVNHLQLLEKLDISHRHGYGIDQKGISCLQFIKTLNVAYNEKITDVNHLQLLENLNISCSYYFDSGVTQYGISRLLNIKKLIACDNKKITDVNHLQNLEELDISYGCKITQSGISNLTKLKKIVCQNKPIDRDYLKKNNLNIYFAGSIAFDI